MDTNIEESKKYTPVRNPDGTFSKGSSGNPGGKLSQGQRKVREFCIKEIPDIMERLKAIYTDDSQPAWMRVQIMFRFIDRAAGKVEEAPVNNDEDDTIEGFTGQQAVQMVKWLMDKTKEMTRDE